jgi:Na+-driven multidrug efflux pump
LAVYVFGVPTYLAGLTYTRAFLAWKRSDWLVVVATSEMVLKLTLNGPLLRHFGLPGLAAATSIMYAVGLVLLAAAFQRTSRAYMGRSSYVR